MVCTMFQSRDRCKRQNPSKAEEGKEEEEEEEEEKLIGKRQDRRLQSELAVLTVSLEEIVAYYRTYNRITVR